MNRVGKAETTEAGFSLLELTLVVLIMAVLVSYSTPRFHKAFEESRADLAASNLEAIWTAQRLYWSKNRVFASGLGQLEKEGLLDPSFLRRIRSDESKFNYEIVESDDRSFNAQAERTGSSHWSGTLAIDEQGILGGEIRGTWGETITAGGASV